MAHVAIFSYVVILMAGLWAISLTHQTRRRFNLPLLKFLMYYIISFNVWIGVDLIAKYAVVNLWEQDFDPDSALFLIPALFVVAFGLTYSLVNVVSRLRGREKAKALSRFIEDHEHLVYEAHSTDYQTQEALQNMVEDHFAILKVGPWLTYALREAVFALADMEKEWFCRKKLICVFVLFQSSC